MLPPASTRPAARAALPVALLAAWVLLLAAPLGPAPAAAGNLPPGHAKKQTHTPIPSATASRTPAPAATATATASRTPTAAATATASPTATRTRTPTATAVSTGTATPTGGVVVPAPATDWIRVDGARLVDSLGREFTPRGFVTITNNSTDGSAVEYTVDDFRRLRAMGATHHVLRVHAGLLGAAPNWPASPYYVARIDAAVARAKEAGLYTVLKLTMYDMALFGFSGWGQLWANQDGEQAAVLDAWRLLWERYRDEPAVLGYDLLNEPEQGTLNATNAAFVADHLTPFYRAAIDALRGIDRRHVVLFQPPKTWPYYPTPLERPQAVYAPHYYPNLTDYLTGGTSTSQYEPLLGTFASTAQWLGVPLWIGEYGMPWAAERDGDATAEGHHAALEQTARDLLDARGLGFTRPWAADDRAATTAGDLVLNWALFKGENGLAGPERTFITDVAVRPYPQALAGTAGTFGYDPGTRRFALSYTPAAARGRTDVHVPRARHYAAGFRVRYATGAAALTLAYDPTKSAGLRVVENPDGLDAGAFAWDETRQVLTLREWLTGQPATLEVLQG